MQTFDDTTPAQVGAPSEERIQVRVHRPPADRIFRGVSRMCGALTLGLMAVIGVFLLQRSMPALRSAGLSFLTEKRWSPTSGHFGIAAVGLGCVLIAVVALAIAVPLAICASLFITEYAPRSMRRILTLLVDLLAAIPSIVYGLWGRSFLQPRMLGISRWLSVHARFIPFFKTSRPQFPASTFIAGTVVSMMVVPICTSVMREVFSQAPPGEKEGALALGATRWGMIRTVVLPFGKGGIIGGSMLGLGRALGETIAVTLIISPSFATTLRILQTGGNSFASLIALRFGDATRFELSGLMAAGLTLFVLTLIVNALASMVVSRSRSGSATEI